MKTDSKSFLHACQLEARIETNAPQGGDAGHGGRTTLILADQGGFAFDPERQQVEITVLGDAEAEALADALEWAGQRLRQMIANEA
jgi:hypothetical protein